MKRIFHPWPSNPGRMAMGAAWLLAAAWLGQGATLSGQDFLLGTWVQPVPRQSVLAQPGYHVWGGSVVEEGGRWHMFYSRWATNTYAWADGWLFQSEICHAAADSPGGPFVPTGVVLGRRANDPELAFWDSQTQHNPHIRRFGTNFYLYYMASVDPGTNAWPGVTQRNRIQRNQRIGVVVAPSIQHLLDGNFVRPSAPIVSPVYSTNAATDRTTNPTDYAANRIVNNPSVIQRPDGKFQLLYKSNWPQAPNYGHGYALAEDPAGPFTLMPGPVFSDQGREDENHWYDPATGRYYLLVKNFAGGGTEQLVSTNSIQWTSQGIQMPTAVPWADGVQETLEALERPQMLRDSNGVPVMLYMAARRGLAGGAKESFNVHLPLRAPVPPPVRAFVLTNAAGVKKSGVLLSAVNFGATAPLAVNGLGFTPSGTTLSTLSNAYGFTQTGGAANASLAAGTVSTVYDGLAEFEGFLDSMVWQTSTVQNGARLRFNLPALPLGRTCRLQVFFGETRAGFRHGPQAVEVAGETFAPFDFGPASSLVAPGATAVKVETTWDVTRTNESVTIHQRVSGGNGLQVSAYALHDVTSPEWVGVTLAPGGMLQVTWRLVPGFRYTPWSSADLASWTEDAAGAIEPAGNAPVEHTFTVPTTQPALFLRLQQSEP